MIRPRIAWIALLPLLASAGRVLADAPNDHFYPQSWHHQQINSEAAWAIMQTLAARLRESESRAES